MTVAAQDFWLSGIWFSIGLPPAGTGAVDADFGFRFVIHGADWLALANPVASLLAQVPGPWSVASYPDEAPPVVIVTGSASVLLAAATIAVVTGAEASALSALVGG